MSRTLTPLPTPVQDWCLALLVTALQLQGTAARVAGDPGSVVRSPTEPWYVGYLLLALSGLALGVRRRRPLTVFAVVAACSLTYYGMGYPDGPGWVALFVSLYTLTALGDGRRSIMLAGLGIGALTVGWFVAARDIEPRAAIGWVFFRVGASALSAALGEGARSRQVIATEATYRAELAERTRDEVARARVDTERLRIAREVHDTVAHAVAIINVQAGMGAHVLDRRPEQAREALSTIEQTSARALDDLRAILGVLRDDGRTPQPGLDRLPTSSLLPAARA